MESPSSTVTLLYRRAPQTATDTESYGTRSETPHITHTHLARQITDNSKELATSIFRVSKRKPLPNLVGY